MSAHDQFEQFYAPLVGGEQQIAQLKESLTEVVLAYDGDFYAMDPYDRLQGAITDRIEQTSHNLDDTKLIFLGKSTVKQTIAVARCVGDIYTKHATAPQSITRVRQNTNKALLHLYTIAFLGDIKGRIQLPAYFRGLSPRNPYLWLTSRSRDQFIDRYFESERIRMSNRTFRTTKDEAGQLNIQPRHRQITLRGPEQRCPAAWAEVGPPGKRRSALWTLISAVGDVAITDIYPRYFPIAAVEEHGLGQRQLDGKG